MATDLSQYDPIFQAAGQEWNVDPTLLKAVAGQESGGNLNAVSSAGAQGLMQITPDTQKYLGITDPKDPTQQIYGAAKYLDEGLNKEGSPEGALLYYHGGPGWRQAYGPESQAYVPAVTARYTALSQAQTSAAPPASSPTTAPSGASQGATPVIVGDSLASPGGLGGSGVVGAVPGAIRSSVAADARKGTYQGQNVVLSSGASNAPGDMTNVEGQLQLLQNGGAKGVTLLGVGPGIETKAPGTNDALQGLATKYGATFVPLPADQMSPDGVHPTARGYKALRTQLASATPITATDASPAPVTATGPGNAMASDDPLSLLPPAPQPAAGGGSATSTAPDEPHPLSLLPSAPQPAGAQAAAPPQGPLPSVSEYGDLGNAWWNTQANPPGYVAPSQSTPPAPYSALPIFPAPAPGAVGRIIDAGRAGFAGALDASGWAPGGVQLGRYIVNPLMEAGGALVRGGQQFLQEAVSPINPQLGRDVASLPEAFPTGDYGAPEAPPTAQAARNALKQPVTVGDITSAIRRSDQAAAAEAPNALVRDQAAPAEQSPVTQQPAPGVSATAPAQAAENTAWVGKTIDQVGNIVQENAAQGGPASLGAAATPEQLAAMSPEMAKAYRRMAEVNRVVSPIEGEDTSIKVPGSVPTEAEAKGDPVTSTREVMTRQYRPEAFEGPQGRLTQNNAARLQMYDDMTPSDPQIATLKEDQAKQAQADEAKVYQNAGPVDGTPVAAQLKQLMANPRIAEQPDVMKVLQPIHDALYDADGNLKTDIASYWGMHDNLMNRLAKAKDPLQASSSEKFAFNQLLDAKNAVDGAMDKASGGAFQTFLDNQSQFFQQQNAATILRDFRSKMTNPNTGMIQPNAFHRFVTDLAVRRGRPGIDPAMDIPDETMGNLMNIDDDLKRAGRIDLGKPRGSPTNLYFELANGLGIVGAHSAVHLMGGGPIANLALQGGINAMKQRVARMRTNALVDRALNYPPEGPPPNPNPPGAFVPPNQLQFPPPP